MPLLWLSLAFLAGIGLNLLAALPAWGWGVLAAAGLGLAALERRVFQAAAWPQRVRAWSRLPLGLVLAALFLGGLRGALDQPVFNPGDLAYYNDLGKAELNGWVAGYPDRREQAVLLRVRVERIRLEGGQPVEVRGDVLARLPAGGDWQYGDRVRLWGEPKTAPEDEDFSYRAYLARRGIYTYMLYPAASKTGSGAGSALMAGIYDLRETAYRTVNRIYPQPEASLLAGILLGLERDLPRELDQAFKDTGTAHIIAISGFNMAVLSGLFVALFGRFLPRPWAGLVATAAIGFYTLLVGANPAVVRAAIMGGLAIAGRLIGRSSAGLTPLAFSAAVMCLFNPGLPADASFQLSFTATLGLVLYAEPLQRGFETWAAKHLPETTAHRLAGPVSEYALFTLAAQVMTLPVTLAQFGRLSLSALLANPLILPAQPLVMQLGGLAVLAGMAWLPLGQALAWLAWPLAAYTIRAVELLAEIPGGVVETGSLRIGFALAAYAVLLGITIAWPRLGGLRTRIRPALILAGLGLVTVLAWDAALHRPDRRLHLAALEVTEGQAVVIHTPGGNRVLIGGGPYANSLAGALGRELGVFNRRLEAAVLPYSRAAALEGLPATLERIPAGQVYWAAERPGKRAADRLEESLARQGVPAVQLAAGQVIELDEGVTLRVLAGGVDSAALELEYGGLRAVWPGGAAPQALARQGIRLAGCLLVLDEADLKETNLAAWQAEHPAAVVVLGSAPADQGCLSNGVNGRVEVISDGAGMRVKVERE